MGMCIEGRWQSSDSWPTRDGRFERADSDFRGQVTVDGSSGFAAEPARYHLYVAMACPWAHRALIFRELKQLRSVISVSTVDPLMLEHGWEFNASHPDPVNGARYLHQLYTRARSDYSGRVTVPVLWDKELQTIVNNESSEIIRMFNSEFAALTGDDTDYYPQELRSQIDEINETIYHHVNNGVYRCGFAGTQEAYDEAVSGLFSTLDQLEQRLADQPYLLGDRLTEADWRLFPTLVRFDGVYHGHFKCNIRRLVDYPNLWKYTRKLYGVEGVAETFDLQETKRHYYGSHKSLNPSGIIPAGPAIDFSGG